MTRHLRMLPAVALLLLFAVPASADNEWSPRVLIAPFYGYRFGGSVHDFYTDTDYNLKGTKAYGGSIALNLRPGVWAEVIYDHQPTRIEINSLYYGIPDLEMNVDEWLAAGYRDIVTGSDTVTPFVGAVAGLTHFSSPEGLFASNDRFALGMDLGARYLPPDSHLGLRIDGRLYATFVDGGSTFYVGPGGLGIGYQGTSVVQGEVAGGVVFAF